MNTEQLCQQVTDLGDKFTKAIEDGKITPAEAIGLAISIITMLIKVFSSKS